ncbi:alpha/beta fold hydrolase, partial [Achromobacter sp. UBA5777]
MTTRTINGLTVEIDGDGPALLCIHGLGGSSNTWTPLMGALTGYRVIRPDLPGSARSPLPDGKLSISGYVDALVSVLKALDCGAVHVVAHSLGTIVAQHLALKEPAGVRSLALFGPLAEPPEAGRPSIRARAALARQGAPAMQEIADAIVKGATSRRT